MLVIEGQRLEVTSRHVTHAVVVALVVVAVVDAPWTKYHHIYHQKVSQSD
jgi:flagellar biosynthesis protein FlhB